MIPLPLACSKRAGAFTLIELLVVITIIAVLAGISVGVVSSMRSRADAIAGQNILRQIGAAIQVFAGDHDGQLPGPLAAGQTPVYDEDESDRLVVQLADYLAVDTEPPDPYLVESLVPPLFPRNLRNLPAPVPYVLNVSAALIEGSETYQFLPFGSNAQAPLKLVAIPRHEKLWILADADREHPAVTGQPWADSTPETPIHNRKRNVLFLDGRVEAVDEDFDW